MTDIGNTNEINFSLSPKLTGDVLRGDMPGH